MTDYNLGRAHGDIVITADTRGAVEAQSAMAATSAEAKGLDATMGRVNDQFAANQRQNVSTAEAIVRHRQQVEDLGRTYQRYHDDYQRAVARTKDAEDALARGRRDENAETNTLLRLARDVEKARDNEERLLGRAEQAHARYQTRLSSVTNEVQRFNQAHVAATSGLNLMRIEAERVGESLENLSSKMSSVLRIVGQGGIMGLFGLGSAASTSAMGASGLSGITSMMAGAIEMVQQLSGVVALLPAALGGGVVALGTLAVAFHGVGESISAMMQADPRKFLDSLRELSPAARLAMETFYSFQDAIRGVRMAIQESTFEPFVAQLQPLLYTWLPLLQEGGKQIGHMFGEMASQVASFLQTASAQQGFQEFIANMVTGLKQAQGAIQPLLQAWQTLSVVGSGFFGRIGAAITQVAGEFNKWVSDAAATGKLQAWINSALTGFTNLAHIVMNVGEGIANFFAIGDKYGGGFLEYLRLLSQEFVNWTNSARGMQTISNFFNLLHQAGAAVTPILKLVGEGFAVIAGALTRLGIQIAPGVQSFFESIVGALRTLAPIIQQAGPSINTFLTEFGKAIAQMVQQAGPELPKLFQGLTQALLDLLPVLPKIVDGVVAILDHLTPSQIEGIFLAAVAIKGMTAAFGLLTLVLDANPITLVIGAIALLAAGVAAAITNFHGFGDAVAGALAPLGELASRAYDWGKHLLENFIHGISDMLQPLDNVASTVANTISDLWKPGSPTKRGPLSDISTEEMGSKLSSGYAAGIAGGTGAVDSAATGVAGAAAGTTGLGFSSAGVSGKSGVGVSGQGKSGFDQYISFITKDLTAWNNIFRESFGLFQTTANTVVQTIKVAASLWNGGDNPMTRPGGIAGPPVAWGQQNVPGIANVQQPGHAPLPNLVPPTVGTGGQQQVPGVQNVGPQGIPRPGDPGFIGPVAGAPSAHPPASVTGQVAPAGNDALSSALAAKGFDAEQIRLIRGFSKVEGNNPAGNPTLGFMDRQLGGDASLQGHVDALAQQFKDRASVAGAFPHGGTDQQQAAWIATVVGQNSSPSGPDGLAQPPRQDYINRVVSAMQGPVAPAAVQGDAGAQGGAIPGARANPSTQANFPLQGTTADAMRAARRAGTFTNQPLYPPGSDTGGYGGANQNVIPSWMREMADRFGLVASTYPEGGTLHQEGFAFDLIPKPGTPQEEGVQRMDAFATFVKGTLGPQTMELIHFNEKTGQKWGIAGGKNVEGQGYYESPNAYGEHGDYGSGAHVHFATDVPPILPGINAPAVGLPPIPPASTVGQIGIPQLPAGPAQRIGSGLHLPGVGALGAALGAGTGAIGAWGAYRGVRGVGDYLNQQRFNEYDARAQLDVIRGLSPQDMDLVGERPNITFGEPGASIQGMNVDLGGVPRSDFSRLSPGEQLQVARDLQAYRGVGVRGGIAGGPTGIPPGRPAASVAGAEGPSVLGRALGGATNAVAVPTLINEAGRVTQQQRAGWLGGGMAAAGTTILGGAALAAGSAAGAGLAPTLLGAAGLGALATATGSATGQETTQTPGVIYGPGGQVVSAGPTRTTGPAPVAGPTTGLTGLDRFGQELINRRASIGADTRTGLGRPSGSQPVHVTNPNDLPGGINATPTPSTQAVKPTDVSQPFGPPGPGRFGGRQGDIRPGQPPAQTQGQLAPTQGQAIPGTGPGGNVDYKTLYDPGNINQGRLPFNAQSPLESFESGMASVGNVASDAFTIFNDVIQNISATAAITDTLVRGVANTEDVVKIIQNFQTYIKTAADVAHLVGDVGGMVGAGGAGDPTGGASAVGGAIQAVSAIVQSALEGVNQAITLGIDIYHEVGKYAGYIMGGFLGGGDTGPLGGNVRMLLNTRTNQIQAYSEDNPLNKNYLNVPTWQRSYNQQPTPAPLAPQINYYAGPGDSPQQFMSDAMYMSTVGSAPVASVSGRD